MTTPFPLFAEGSDDYLVADASELGDSTKIQDDPDQIITRGGNTLITRGGNNLVAHNTLTVSPILLFAEADEGFLTAVIDG